MKKLLFFLFAIATILPASAQDVIVKKDGSTVLCRIIEVNGSDVIFKKWSDLDGANYIMDRSQISNINYQDGRQDKLNEQTSNAYAPGNQQTGQGQYNDNALYKLDKTRNLYSDQARKYKIIGWTVGGVCVAGGLGLLIYGIKEDYLICEILGGVLMGGGAATTTVCLIKAHKIEKKALQIASAPIIQKEFNFGNQTSLSAGVDMIHDNKLNTTTLGLGLHFNF